MSDTNKQIAELLSKQTYTERIEMASDFKMYVDSYYEGARENSNDPLEPDMHEIALWFDAYVELMEEE